ncbi:magnetosome biogenesis transporter MamH [Magnetococcales bacterium HHB-1]
MNEKENHQAEPGMSQLGQHHYNALYLVVAILVIFMTLILAIQPLYLRHVLGLARENAGSVNANVQIATEVVDLLLVGYLGNLSDRLGRVPLLIGGFLTAGVAAFLAPLSGQIGLFIGVSGLAFFYLARMVMSLGTTAVWPQVATLAGDYSTQEDRPQKLARVGFMMAFAATLVYAVLMQIPKHAGVTVTLWLAAIIALIGAWLAKNYLVEAIKPKTSHTFPAREVWELVKREPGLRLSFLSAFTSRNDMVIVGLFLMTWFIYFSDLIEEITHAQAASQAGMMIGFIGLVILMSITAWGRSVSRIGRVPAVAMGLFLSGIGFVAFGLNVNPFGWWMLIPAFFVGLGQAGCLLAPQTLALDLAPKEIRGSVLGVFNTVGCIGIIFFLLVGGILFDYVGPTAPFIFTGIANFLIVGYALIVMNGEKQRPTHSDTNF